MADIVKITTPAPADYLETHQWLDEFLTSRPGTVKEFQNAWQAYKYLLRDKMYAYIGIHDKSGRPIITLKLEPAFSDILRQQYVDITEGYYMNKTHWSTIYLDGEVPHEVILDIATAAHEVLLARLSKKAQHEIMGED